MSGKQTHIDVTAYHEAGHALAALKVGSYVGKVAVNLANPGEGVTFHYSPPRNPFDLARNPDFAWRHTYQTTLDTMFILLAGPMAEAKLLHKPLRDLGSYSDYNACMKLCLRLRDLAEFAGEYTDSPIIKFDELLDQQRDRTRRWLGHPKTWRMVDAIASALIKHGQLDGHILAMAIGSKNPARQMNLLEKSGKKKVTHAKQSAPELHIVETVDLSITINIKPPVDPHLVPNIVGLTRKQVADAILPLAKNIWDETINVDIFHSGKIPSDIVATMPDGKFPKGYLDGNTVVLVCDMLRDAQDAIRTFIQISKRYFGVDSWEELGALLAVIKKNGPAHHAIMKEMKELFGSYNPSTKEKDLKGMAEEDRVKEFIALAGKHKGKDDRVRTVISKVKAALFG